jgi:hypothetical protein
MCVDVMYFGISYFLDYYYVWYDLTKLNFQLISWYISNIYAIRCIDTCANVSCV